MRGTQGALVVAGLLLLLLNLVAAWSVQTEIPVPAGLAPSCTHWLGTTPSGQDVVFLALAGAQRMVNEGVYASMLTAGVGLATGILLSWHGRQLVWKPLAGLTVVLDLVGPTLPLAAFAAAFPRAGAIPTGLAVALVAWPSIALPVRDALERAWEKPFVQASKTLGASNWRITRLHVAPEVAGVVVPWLAAFGAQITAFFAALQFLGVGSRGPENLGAAVYTASSTLRQAPWHFLGVAGAVLAVQAAFGLIGFLAGRNGKALSA